MFLKSAGSYENAREIERALLVTDVYGYAETSKWLPYGVYTVKQTKGLEGKELMPAFDVRINEDGKTYRYLINNATFEAEIEIVKKDSETGKVIPASGIGFKVRNTDTGEYVIQHINYPTPMDIEIYYAACCGVADRVLFQMLSDNPNIKTVCLCLDNDEAGHKANKRISDKLFTQGIQTEILVPSHKDWNEDLLYPEESEDEDQCPELQLS